MKTNPSDLATGRGITEIEPGKYGVIGLTKREYFAAMAMQGMIQHLDKYTLPFGPGIALDAVILADALIEELNKAEEAKNE